MCGRYCITTAPEAIRRLFRYAEQPNFPPRYNVAPTQPVPIVRMADGQRHFALVRWGLIPSWVKDPKNFTLLINARGESVNEKPAFRNAMKRRRCLFPADGFYEWKAEGGRKRPYLARLKGGGPLAFAGLWETWTGPNGEEVETAAIVTTEANPEMAAVHHRAPAIVPPEQFDFWLDCANVDEKMAAALIGPVPAGSMEVYEISTAVNRVANDSPDLIAHVSGGDAAALAEPAKQQTETKASEKPAPKRKRAKNDGQASLF
jgi:putative SOS response-associated peptidase YedK